MVCGRCDRRTLLPGDREIGGVGPRLRQADVGEGALVAAGPAALHDHARVDAEEEHQAENDENAENADAAAAGPTAAARKADTAAWEGEAEAAALVAPVLDILALSFAAPAHGSLTSLSGQTARFSPIVHAPRRRHKVHPGRGGTLGLRGVKVRGGLRVGRHAV